MSTLETQYREYLRNNRGGFCSFEEWKEIHGNQIKQALIEMMEKDEELGLYDDIKANRKALICKDCSDSLEDCTCIEDTVDFPKQEDKFCYYSGLPSPTAYSKEEIKLEEVFNDEKKENIKKFIDEIINPSQPNDKLKQAFEKYSEYLEDYENKNTYEHGFKDGAKWQQEQYTIEEQHVGHTIDELDKEYIKGFNEGSAYYIERMYSEEEVINIAKQAFVLGKDFGLIGTFNEWFEQFKKK